MSRYFWYNYASRVPVFNNPASKFPTGNSCTSADDKNIVHWIERLICMLLVYAGKWLGN